MEQSGKNLEDMSVIELKSTVYDILAMIENGQKNIQVINQLIQKKSAPVVETK